MWVAFVNLLTPSIFWSWTGICRNKERMVQESMPIRDAFCPGELSVGVFHCGRDHTTPIFPILKFFTTKKFL